MPKDKIVFTVPEGFTLELLVDDADNPERQDPMWHTNGDGGATDVAKVTYKGNSAFVFSCGEMRIYDKVTDSVVKTTRDLEWIGISTDLESMSDRYEWEYNSWYEAHLESTEYYSEPEFDIGGAITSAIQLLLQKEKENA